MASGQELRKKLSQVSSLVGGRHFQDVPRKPRPEGETMLLFRARGLREFDQRPSNLSITHKLSCIKALEEV